MFLIDAIKPNLENKFKLVLFFTQLFRGGDRVGKVQNKTSFSYKYGSILKKKFPLNLKTKIVLKKISPQGFRFQC